jgi:alkanesulfonate monooxygenase SsuD/methylene tetrahydromethanopterin reductase-like flavin-dependent oxidoreductase (luciferase family)
VHEVAARAERTGFDAFDARDVIARPRPVQTPIPIWIGGNSKLARRARAAMAPAGPDRPTIHGAYC